MSTFFDYDDCVMQRLKVVSDLLIAVARSERQEARVKVRQDVARLGGIGVMR